MVNSKKLFKKVLALSLSISIIASLFVFTEINVVAAGKTYYVSTTGKDTNTGTTLDTAFLTINKAMEAAQAGDTVAVRGGVYKQKVTFEKSGSLGAPITLKNYNGEVPILDGTGSSVTSDETAMINLYDISYAVIDGFEIRNLSTTSSYTPMGIIVDGSGKGLEIRNCKVHDIKTNNTSNSPSKTNAHGIAVYGANGSAPIDGIVLEGNEIYNCVLGWSEALAVNGNVMNFKIINNKVHDNNNIGIVMIGYENTASANDYARNGVCSGNKVYNTTSKYNPAYGYKKNADGTYKLGECSSDGIYVDGGSDILINQNIVYNCDIGVEVATEGGPYAKNVTVSNNLIYDCIGQAGLSMGNAEDAKSQAYNVVQNLKVINNTFYGNAKDLQVQRVSDSTNVVKNNIFASSTKISGTVGNNIINNNITSDPKFVNVENKDFHLQAGSSAIDKGVVMNYGSYDLDGAARVFGTAVDCGCYEYQTVSVTSTPTSKPTSTPTSKPTSTPKFTPTSTPIPSAPVNITIDGNSSEWGSIDTYAASSSGNATRMKVYNDSRYLYVCITGSNLNDTPNFTLLINSDNNVKTGYRSTVWGAVGFDWNVECNELYRYSGTGYNWRWSLKQVISFKSSSNCIEVKIPLSVLSINSGSTITLGYVGMDDDWNEMGYLPEGSLPNYKLK